MRYRNPKLINQLSNIINQFNSFEGVASEDIVSTDEWRYLSKGEKFEFEIEYGNPEEVFHINLYVNGNYGSSECFFDNKEELEECLSILTKLKSDVTSDLYPDFVPSQPQRLPQQKFEGSIAHVREMVEAYKQSYRVTMLCDFKDVDTDYALAILEYESISEAERQYYAEQYEASGQAMHDAKQEKWDWLKNEF